MKYVLFIALLLPNLLWAQENVKKKNSIQIIKGIGVGYHILEMSPQIEPAFYMSRIESSNVGMNYRFGIDYQRQIIGGLSMKIGSRFSLWSLNNVSTINNNYICCMGIVEGGCYDYYMNDEELRQYYVEMPVALQYKFGTNKLQFYVEVGANPMLSISEGNYPRNEKPFSFAVQVGAGLSYQLSNDCSIFGQFSSRVQTEELILYTNYGYLYEVGLEIGAAFYF